MGSSESSAQAHSLRSAQNAVGTVINAARAHLVELQSAGVGYRQAAKLAGVSIQTVQDIRSGRVRKFKTETIEAVLGVRVKLAPGALVNGLRNAAADTGPEARRVLRGGDRASSRFASRPDRVGR
jgi:hypothetical protein